MRKSKKLPVKTTTLITTIPLSAPKTTIFQSWLMTMLSNLIFIFLIPWETHRFFFFFFDKYCICICAVEVILDSNLHKLVTSRFGVEYYVYACLTDSKWQMKSLSSTGNSKMDTIRLVVKFWRWNFASWGWSSLQC